MDGSSYKSYQPLRRTPSITAVQTVGYCESRLLRKQMTRPPEKQGEMEARIIPRIRGYEERASWAVITPAPGPRGEKEDLIPSGQLIASVCSWDKVSGANGDAGFRLTRREP
ncbi:hypothetical protein ATEIFO6365_0006013800 [Aspergillus terreus]|uniref:Uncharacterized protein n=1 Tax=Aspergillus terreus TaxID=33178 RepID=A0A5M3YW27_ASPTE|nr:hypothetical protein ATETN484_0005013600 [Aspergillus terreus]GFF16801.1 hypothetical protein ATEIFO6365_0006013800 [Aspergillus terreus]